MKNAIKTMLFFLVSTTILLSCKQEELMTYEATDNIYFYYTSTPVGTAPGIYRDTAHVKFGMRQTVQDDSVTFFVNILGDTAVMNRNFTMEVDDNLSTALAGAHYELPPLDDFYIPAGSVAKRLVVKILRPITLRDTVVDLYLNLVPNANFNTNLPVYTYSANTETKATTLRIIIEDRLARPVIWDSAIDALGKYSRKKLELMINLYSLSINRFYNPTLYTASQLTSYARQMQAYLKTQKNLGNIIFEEDGSEMIMGPAVQ